MKLNLNAAASSSTICPTKTSVGANLYINGKIHGLLTEIWILEELHTPINLSFIMYELMIEQWEDERMLYIE